MVYLSSPQLLQCGSPRLSAFADLHIPGNIGAVFIGSCQGTEIWNQLFLAQYQQEGCRFASPGLFVQTTVASVAGVIAAGIGYPLPVRTYADPFWPCWSAVNFTRQGEADALYVTFEITSQTLDLAYVVLSGRQGRHGMIMNLTLTLSSPGDSRDVSPVAIGASTSLIRRMAQFQKEKVSSANLIYPLAQGLVAQIQLTKLEPDGPASGLMEGCPCTSP